MALAVSLSLVFGFLVVAAAIVWTARSRPAPQAAVPELDERAHAFTAQMAGMRTELQRLDHLMTTMHASTAEQHGTLIANLRQVTATNASLAQHTDALRRALASPKQRGQWGERMADDVLAAAGMVEGVNFLRQKAIAGGTVPDFRFLLPGDLEVRMDVKFPIDNYLRVLESESDGDRAGYTKAFVADVRNRVKELAGRGYIDPCDTVDCMLLFIPNEAVHAFLHDADPELVDVALGQRVVLCSPGTLFAVLAVVRRSVEQFRLQRMGDEILRCLGAVTGEWTKFTDSLDKVARQLDTVSRTFCDELNGTRRRVFEKTLTEVDRLRDAETSLPPAGGGEALAARKADGDVRSLPVDRHGRSVADAV